MVTQEKPWWTKHMRDQRKECPDLEFHGMDDSPHEVFQGETMSCWNFCGCGDPGVVMRNMIAYMRSCADNPETTIVGNAWDEWYAGYKQRHPIKDQDVFWFCAYLADAADWTEHGGSVNSAWLTPAGEAWLRDAEVWEKAHDPVPPTTSEG